MQSKSNIKEYFFLILLVAFLTSLNGLQKFPILFLISKITGFLIVAFTFFTAGISIFPKSIKYFVAFILISFLSGMLVSIDFQNVLQMVLTLVQLLIIIIMVIQYYVLKGDYKFLLIAFILNGIVLVLAGKFMNPEMAIGKQDRLTSLVFNSNELGRQMLYAGVCTIFFWRNGRFRTRVVIVFLELLFFYYVALSGSRTALVTFVLIFFFWIVFSFKPHVYLKYLILMGILSIAVGGYLFQTYLADSPAIQRLYSIEDEAEQGGSTGTRIRLYNDAGEAFATNPFLGVGLDNFRLFTARKTYAHSNYMELLADTGFVGFALFYMIYLTIWKSSQNFSKDIDDEWYKGGFLKTIILLQIILGFSVPTYYNIPAWLFLSIAIIIFEKEKRINPNFRSTNKYTFTS